MQHRARPAMAALCLALGCAGDPAREADRPFRLASVDSVQVVLQPSQRPVVRAQVRGTLPDSCTKLDRESWRRRGQRIHVTLTTRRESGIECEEGPRPFTRTLVLATSRLPGGLYTLDVNGHEALVDLPTRVGVDPSQELREPLFD